MDGKHSTSAAARQDANAKEWKFSDLIADPVVRERWERVRRYFFLRESTYDMTRRCNIRCEGCYYFEGDKQHAAEVRDPAAWRALMQAEQERGITYVVLAGAEPSLVPELLAVCFDEMPLGAIATNGIQRIPESVGYKIHISVWGNDDTSLRIRKRQAYAGPADRQLPRRSPGGLCLHLHAAQYRSRPARWPKHWPDKDAGSPSTCFPRRWVTPVRCAIRPSRSPRPVGPCSTCWRVTRRTFSSPLTMSWPIRTDGGCTICSAAPILAATLRRTSAWDARSASTAPI